MIGINIFEKWLSDAKEAIELAEQEGFTREQAIELLKIYHIWVSND